MTNLLYQRITNQVIANLEQAGSWQQLWNVPQPVSLGGHTYRGINHLLLSGSSYDSVVWGTFNQIRQNGGAVNKGEKSRLVVFWKKMTDTAADTLTGKQERVDKYLLRYYLVFNTDQCTFDAQGMDKIQHLSGASESLFKQRNISAEQIVHLMPDRPKIRTGAFHTPCYIPQLDEIKMPELRYFFNSDAYYGALFHELIHSTGHKSRLNRFQADQFSNEASYSKEELVAEMGAAYLCALAGIEPNLDNTRAYIKSWLTVLESNTRWVSWAAIRAQKACDFIVPQLPVEQQEEVVQENTVEL